MIERIESPAPAELEALTDLWERSVRATHGFLAPEDTAFFRRMVFSAAWCARRRFRAWRNSM